jgi:transcriptional regulator with XRE-family HTH domain
VRGWNQREASQRAGIQPDRLSRIERGAEPGIDEAAALSRAFGLSFEELLYGGARAGDELDLLAQEMRSVLSPEDFRAILRIFRALIVGYRAQAAS